MLIYKACYGNRSNYIYKNCNLPICMNHNFSVNLAETDDDFLDVILLKHEDDSTAGFVSSEDATFEHVLSLREYGYNFWIARQGNKAIGYAVGNAENSDIYRSEGIYVAPDFRRQGVGFNLKKAQINFARENEFTELLADLTETNVAGKHIHEKLGFEIKPNGLGYTATLYVQMDHIK